MMGVSENVPYVPCRVSEGGFGKRALRALPQVIPNDINAVLSLRARRAPENKPPFHAYSGARVCTCVKGVSKNVPYVPYVPCLVSEGGPA